MKTFKFFLFSMLISLVWVACKDANTTADETPQTAEALAADVLGTNKSTATEHLANMQTVVTTKISELEAAVATASGAAKADLSIQLDSFKKMQSDIKAATVKVKESTLENWSTVANEIEGLHAAIKTAIVGASGENTGAISTQ